MGQQADADILFCLLFPHGFCSFLFCKGIIAHKSHFVDSFPGMGAGLFRAEACLFGFLVYNNDMFAFITAERGKNHG